MWHKAIKIVKNDAKGSKVETFEYLHLSLRCEIQMGDFALCLLASVLSDFGKFMQILFPSFQKDGQILRFSYLPSDVLTRKICIILNFMPASKS